MRSKLSSPFSAPPRPNRLSRWTAVATLLMIGAMLLTPMAATAQMLPTTSPIPTPPPWPPEPMPPPPPWPEPLPPPPALQVTLAEHRVEATIDGAIAEVQVTQIFRNDSVSLLEGSYIFPLPADANQKFLLRMADGVDEARVAAAGEDNEAVDGFEPERKVIGDRVGLRFVRVKVKRAASVLEVGNAGDRAGDTDARAQVVRRVENDASFWR